MVSTVILVLAAALLLVGFTGLLCAWLALHWRIDVYEPLVTWSTRLVLASLVTMVAALFF